MTPERRAYLLMLGSSGNGARVTRLPTDPDPATFADDEDETHAVLWGGLQDLMDGDEERAISRLRDAGLLPGEPPKSEQQDLTERIQTGEIQRYGARYMPSERSEKLVGQAMHGDSVDERRAQRERLLREGGAERAQGGARLGRGTSAIDPAKVEIERQYREAEAREKRAMSAHSGANPAEMEALRRAARPERYSSRKSVGS